MSNFIPDIADFLGTKGQDQSDVTAEKYGELLIALKKKYRMTLRNRIAQFQDNAKAYLNQRAFKGDPSEIVFKKVFKDARFIAAHASRFQVGGMDLTGVQTFMLHRPSFDRVTSLMESVIAWFSMTGSDASSHFVAGQDGALVQMVDLADIAHHTAASGPKFGNDVSIGVEIEGAIGDPISDQLYRTVASLIARVSLLSVNFTIDADHVIEHRAVLPKEKPDVGAPLQMQRLLTLAKDLVSTYNKDDLFKQVSADAALKSNLEAVVALSATGVLSVADKSLIQTMANSSDAILRATNWAVFNRSDMATAAAQQAQAIAEQQAQLLAFQLAMAGMNAQPTPQTNVAGLLWSFTTGTYNVTNPTGSKTQ